MNAAIARLVKTTPTWAKKTSKFNEARPLQELALALAISFFLYLIV